MPLQQSSLEKTRPSLQGKLRIGSLPAQPLSCFAVALQDASPELAVDDENEADAMEIYAAVKPSGDEPKLAGELPELSARLHTYQRRSAAWMVQRELAPQVGSPQPHSHIDWQDRPYLPGIGDLELQSLGKTVN